MRYRTAVMTMPTKSPTAADSSRPERKSPKARNRKLKRDEIDRAYAAALWYKNLQDTTNACFLPLFFDTHRFLVLKGGGGSGKSVFAARKIVERAVSEPGHRFLVCRKVGNTLRQSCFRLICALISTYYPDAGAKIRSGDMTIAFPNGSEILFSGLDDVEKLKSIYEITDIWIEEATELDESDLNQLNIRMRGKSPYYRQMIITFNPVNILHWLKRRFFDGQRPEISARIKTHESTYRDNRFLSTEDKEELEHYKYIDPYYYQVYCLGEWGVTGKTVFSAAKLSARLQWLLERKPKWKTGSFIYEYELEQITDSTINFVESDDGFIRILRDAESGVPYVIGADTAGDGSDWFVAQVLDNRTGEQVCVMRCQTDEDLFTKQLYCLGRHYNDALLAPETNFSSFPVRELQRLGYDNLFVRDVIDSFTHETKKQFGFRTDPKSRPVVIAGLVQVARENPENINDITTIDEMLTFVRDEHFRAAAADGAHDDCVMSLAIAHYLRPYQRCVAEAPTEKEVVWHESLWEDYRNADEEGRKMLIKRYGHPRGLST